MAEIGPSQYNITFRALKLDDFAIIYEWFKQPEIKRWYARGKDWTLADIERKYLPRIRGEEVVPSFIMTADTKDIGFIQYYPFSKKALPEGMSVVFLDKMKINPNVSAGIDLFIGEETLIGIGLGTIILREFIKHQIPKQFTNLYIDPESINHRAIKSYTKVGFKPMHVQPTDNICLMYLEREKLL